MISVADFVLCVTICVTPVWMALRFAMKSVAVLTTSSTGIFCKNAGYSSSSNNPSKEMLGWILVICSISLIVLCITIGTLPFYLKPLINVHIRRRVIRAQSGIFRHSASGEAFLRSNR